MKVIPRTHFGNPILRTKTESLDPKITKLPAFKELTRQMFYTMHQAAGVGLAAPQIDQPLRMAVIHVSSEKSRGESKEGLRRVIINPKIIWHSNKKNLDWEGCLSFPGVRGEVPRWSEIRVSFINEKGKKITEKHSGFAARVFQHEIDHLDGKLYVDRMKDMTTLMTYKEFLKHFS